MFYSFLATDIHEWFSSRIVDNPTSSLSTCETRRKYRVVLHHFKTVMYSASVLDVATQHRLKYCHVTSVSYSCNVYPA